MFLKLTESFCFVTYLWNDPRILTLLVISITVLVCRLW